MMGHATIAQSLGRFISQDPMGLAAGTLIFTDMLTMRRQMRRIRVGFQHWTFNIASGGRP